MEGNESETAAAAEESEEIECDSVKLSMTPPLRAKAAREERVSCPRSAVLPGLATVFGIVGISLVITLVWKMSDSHPHCPELWVTYRGSCYSFSKEKKDWNSSRESCRAQGAHLLVISDTLEKDLFKRIQVENFWIGLRNSASSGWIWEDGSIVNDTTIWSNSPVQHCAVLMKGQFWASSCEVPAPWICEKSLQ
ncbi:PREDICTED: killer cell lectin-like receptor subfamily G member 1 [Acanthisitta chloris]|uniref:killer cell lectin-like receptor subfamily G member 1 n=1 Tax=Acanthisitta chloris TaxID=57068 RepID=UPI0004F0F265|nr:PREDICTED: killer cell lectin-like receptor subfamily G member 1 [Acanthisitta chloris]